MVQPTETRMDYGTIQKLNDCRPCTFDTTREKWWYEIGLIDGAKAADIKNDDTRPITVDFLKNNFEYSSEASKMFSTTKKQTQTSVDVFGTDGTWKVVIEDNVVYIKTIGQFKMFLTLCGVQDFVKQLK